ncbi:Spy/CpxP family protein refolding chaperone [candidate division KSB1 bacterium]
MNIITLTFVWSIRQHKDVSCIIPEHSSPEKIKKTAHYLLHKYDLKDEQIDQFFEFKEKHFSQSSEKLEEIRNLKEEVYKELFDENPDTIKVNKIIEQIGGKYSEIIQMNFYHFFELKSIFPEDHQEQYKLFVKDIIKRMDHFRHGPRGDMQRGPMHKHNP